MRGLGSKERKSNNTLVNASVDCASRGHSEVTGKSASDEGHLSCPRAEAGVNEEGSLVRAGIAAGDRTACAKAQWHRRITV